LIIIVFSSYQGKNSNIHLVIDKLAGSVISSLLLMQYALVDWGSR